MGSESKVLVKKNTVYQAIRTIATVIFPLIVFPYVNRVLTPKNVGKISFCKSIISYFTLIATLGINTYAIRECSKAKDSKKQLEKVASQIFSINICTTFIAYIALSVCIFTIPKLNTNWGLLLILSASIFLSTFGADWLNTAMEDFKYLTIRSIIFQVISLIGLLLLVHKPEDYLVYAIISVISSSGAYLVNVIYRRKFCAIRFTIEMQWKQHFPGIILLFAMLLAQTIYTNIDTTMIGLMMNDIDVGFYSVSIKIYRLVQQVIAALLWVVLPSLTRSYSSKDYTEINKTLKYVISYYAVIGIPCCVGIFFAAPEIIYIIGGSEYLAATGSLMILSFSLLFTLAGEMFIGNIILLPSGRESYFLKSCIITTIADIVGNYFLIPIWGINGAAFATTLAGILNLLILSIAVEKDIQFEGVINVFRSPIIGSLFIPIVIFICRKTIDNILFRSFVSIVLCVVLYLIVITAMRNELVIDIIRSIKAKIKK